MVALDYQFAEDAVVRMTECALLLEQHPLQLAVAALHRLGTARRHSHVGQADLQMWYYWVLPVDLTQEVDDCTVVKMLQKCQQQSWKAPELPQQRMGNGLEAVLKLWQKPDCLQHCLLWQTNDGCVQFGKRKA